MRRGTAVTAAVAVAVLAAGGGWLAGRNFKSPQQVALEAEPPPASLITVEVELAELVADVITRADVGYDEPVSLGLSGAIGDRQSQLVVTWAPERGAELVDGSAAIEIAGRPVFLLAGEVPVFRDLRPGDSGPDVRQLEEALARLGHLDGEPDDSWDAATGDALTALYEAAGYDPVGVSAAERAELRVARDRLDAARASLTSDETALGEARKGPAAVAVAQARTEAAAAQAALVQARMDRERSAEESERALADARRSHEDALGALEEARRAVVAAEAAREQSARQHDQARLRWQSAQTGVHPDTGASPTAMQHESLRLAARAAQGDLAAAERAVTASERAVQDAELEARRRAEAIPSAEELAAAATRADLSARSAQDRVAAAQQALEALLEPADTTALERRVSLARVEVEDAVTRLNELQATTGVWLPAGELIMLRRLPVRVDLLAVERGNVVAGSFMTVTGSELAVRGSVSERDVDRVSEGAEARIDDRSLEAPVEGAIRFVDRRVGTRGVGPDRHYLEITARGIPDHLVGRNVKIVIPVGGTDGAVLVVPVAALSAGADGSTRVEVEQPDGSTRAVVVEPGLSTGGRVEVTPVSSDLSAGDRVVVGVAAGE